LVAVPTRQDAEAVSADCPEVERKLEAANPGSRDEDRLTASAADLRGQYQRLVEQVLAGASASTAAPVCL
jgi:hypothetical protein